MPAILIDISGQRFGRLVVQSRAPNVGRQTAWHCLCDCGGTSISLGCNLKNGTAASCGCLQIELARKKATTHGLKRHPLYRVWGGMISRCYNPNYKDYHLYGGRGIVLCERWRSSFQNFYDDMIVGYEKGLSIERLNNNVGYEPLNCKWIPCRDQPKNRRPYSEWTFKRRGKDVPHVRGVSS